MRYRRVSYRYAMVVSSHEPRPFGDPWWVTQARVPLAQPRWRPPADVSENATSILITIELAGVDPEELDILLYEDAVVVEGTRRLPGERPCIFHEVEIRQGPFRVEVALPATIDPERVDAQYDRGLLHLTLAKAGEGSRE